MPPTPLLPAVILAGGMTALTPSAPVHAQTSTPPAAPPDAAMRVAPTGQTVRSITPAASPAVVLRGKSGVVLRNLHITADTSVDLADCDDITIIGCDLRSIKASNVKRLRVFNSFIHDSKNNGVELDACADVVVQGNRIERVSSGVYAHRSTAVQVVGNYCRDVRGPMPRGQLVQFDKVTGPDNLILANHAVNFAGRSRPEDLINLHQSTGTADSPIRVEMNYLAGDPVKGSRDKSPSGSGIMLGDGGGRYQVAADNVIIDAGQVGIGIAGGGDIAVRRNVILGRRSNVSNVGLYVWNQYEDAPAHAVTVTDNRIDWINSQNVSNPYWDGGGFPTVTQQRNTLGDPSLRDAIPAPPRPAPLPPLFHGTDVEVPYPLP